MSVLNLGDPEFELIDPTPNVHALFLQFDQTFFWAKLSSRAVVRWSKRMYSCAGICSYDRGGLCDIALSEPLLKLRPRKDLVETLLHEMIHAFLFITCRDQDRDGHGPNFKEHMFRINKAAGLNISIYHDFHDEVKLYQTHWWRCDGPCQALRPHFGIVRRTANRAPGPSEYWWKDHQRKCGGTFIKIKEPELKLKGKKENKINNGDITKFVTKGNNKKDKPVLTVSKPVLKDSNVNKKKWSDTNLVVSKTNNIVFNPKLSKPVLKDNHIDKKQQTSDVVMTVRNVWANKTLAPSINTSNVNQNTKKRHSSDLVNRKPIPVKSPPKKIMKIDDYFNKTASNLLKDIYGQEFNITQSEKDSKLIPVLVQNNLVNCPICDVKINSDKINNHLDECLNKDVIEILSQNNQDNVICNSEIENKHDTEVIDLTNIQFEMPKNEIPATAEESKMNVETKDGFDDMEYFEDVILDEKILSGSSKVGYNCPCCGKVTQSIEEHLDECLAFDNTTIPEEGASTSTTDTDEVDIHDETLTLNATGTMSPCPCCMKMVEMADMNDHLDNCFGSSFSKNFDDS